MNVITDIVESKAFAKNMSQSLADLGLWEGWHLLDVTSTPPLDWIRQAKLSALVRTKISDDDGSALWMEGAFVVVFRASGEVDLQDFQAAAAQALEGASLNFILLSVARETQRVKEILIRRQGDATSAKGPPPASYHFLKELVPNIDELLRGWHEEQKKREGRTRPRLMVVDDDPLVLKMAGRALGRDYEVIVAQNGAEAVAKHLQQMPDVIFLDIGLPDCDGLTLLNYMQQYDSSCRIVMFSADDFLKTRVKALAGGAKGFLPKPFSLRAFQSQIAAWFSGEGK